MSQRLTSNEQKALDLFVHTPSETSANFVRFAKEIREFDGITWGCELDKHIIPLRPPRVLGLLGRPGHQKTSLGAFIVRKEAIRLVASGLASTKYVAHISWEQSAEELESLYHTMTGYGVTDVAWGRVDQESVIIDSIRRPELPVWIFGESMFKSDFDTPPMTIDAVYYAIQAIWKERGMTPSALFIDYIQDIPVPEEKERYAQVSSAMRKVKRLAIQAKCPIVLGIQANQRTDDYAHAIPTMRDAEWSSVIGQKLDTLVALWKPIRSFLPHDKETIQVGGAEYPNTENLLVVKLLKQRLEKGYGIWAVDFDPNTMELKDAVRGYGNHYGGYNQ